jgi:hypothetical protein
MTLKERFINYCDDVFMDKEVNAGCCEKIADDYAIKFAEWIEELSGSHIDSLDYHLYLDNDVKELLEIFKNEKGL